MLAQDLARMPLGHAQHGRDMLNPRTPGRRCHEQLFRQLGKNESIELQSGQLPAEPAGFCRTFDGNLNSRQAGRLHVRGQSRRHFSPMPRPAVVIDNGDNGGSNMAAGP